MNGMEARKHTVAHDGRQVCWHQMGSGPHLVLLHGGHGSWQHWVRNAAVLARNFTVWVPDMPGYGESDAPPEPTLASLTDLTWATLDSLVGPASAINLVGFSFGALVAAQLAAQSPQVQRMALLGPAGHGGVRRPKGDLLPWRAALQSGDKQALAQVMRANLAVHMLHDPVRIDDQAVQLHTTACLQTRFHSKTISRAAGLRAALGLYFGPLLLLWGEHDVTVQPDLMGRSLSEGRTDCCVHRVTDAGHWVQYEQADAVNMLLLDWLEPKHD